MALLKVVHLITHLAVGGATENTLTTCRYSSRDRFDSLILAGSTQSTEQNLSERAAEHHVAVEVLPELYRSIHPREDLRAYGVLLKWLRANPCDILHTHGSKAGILGRLAAARAGVPIRIHTVHGWGHHPYMSRPVRAFYIALERRAARLTDRIIVVAHANREKGLKDGIGKPEQYAVIHSGIDIALFRDSRVDANDVRRGLELDSDAPVIGSISRLARQKAPEDFLRVAELVRRRCPPAKFVFIGGGPLEREFLERRAEMRLEDCVFYLGYRPDVPALLRAFDVFLLTSLWEGLPRVYPQAMCAGLPVVGTDVDGAPEAVQEGETGFLVPPRDCEAMADRVLRLLADEKLRARMGRAAVERVSPRFCDREMVRQIEQVYLECAADAPLLSASPGRLSH